MWIARDENGSLWLYINKPVKRGISWEGEDGDYVQLPSDWYGFIKSNEEEPREVELVIE